MYATVEELEAAVIRLNNLGGYTRKRLGDRVGVSEATISRIVAESKKVPTLVETPVNLNKLFNDLWHCT